MAAVAVAAVAVAAVAVAAVAAEAVAAQAECPRVLVWDCRDPEAGHPGQAE